MENTTQKKYLISVVTPFHNVDMKFFRKGYESLKEQTIGFSNIEWIVVLHNTEQKYHEEVHKLLDKYDNVILKTLNNDARTPSSPRNYGMQFATAPYIGFLDGDDSYTPKCFQTTINAMQRTNSQMVVFRREFELEEEGLFPLTEIVLWDQTREEIVIDRDNWDDEKMFTGIWGMVTSRIYDREFLDKHNIVFDEEVPFTEDVLFIIEAYGKLDRVCYLPRFIGYRYFINSESLVQSMANKSAETLIAYANGFATIFDTAYKNGVYADYLVAALLTMFSDALVHSKNLTLENRREIKEVLESYVHNIPYLPINKIVSENDAKAFYEIPREVILHPENFDSGIHMKNAWNGQNVLEAILKENKNTDYGTRYHFDILRSMEGYQTRIPLAQYDTYAPLIDLQTKIGESGIFAAEPMECYLLSSGSMLTERLIPATKKHLEPYIDAFAKIMHGRTTFLLAESLPIRKHYNDRAVLNSLSGIILTKFLRSERDTLSRKKAKFTSPELLLSPPEAMDLLYLRLLFALSEKDVEQIVAPFTWGIAEALSFMENHWEDLCVDIEKGQITFALDVSESFLRQIDALLVPNPERADELRSIFKEGFEAPIAKRIWRKLNKIVAFGASTFSIYTDQIKRYTGDIPFSNGYAMSAKALYGKATDNEEDFELTVGQNFYEFLPFDKEENDAPLLLCDAKAGSDYELIVTNHAGLYRYRTGDIIRVKENKSGKLVFSPLGKRHAFIKIGDALLGENDIYKGIKTVAKKEGYKCADFAFFNDQESDEERLKILLEPVKSDDKISINTEKFAALLDETLCNINDKYAKARGDGFPQLTVSIIQHQTQLLYRDVRRFKHKTAPDEIRPARFLNTPAKVKFFLRNIE